MRRKKLYIQIAICVAVVFAVNVMERVDSGIVSGFLEKSREVAGYNISIDDIEILANKAVSVVKDAPAKVVSTVIEVNKASRYGAPIDEKSKEKIKQVHSVAGGMVLNVGKSSEKGLFVEIRHEGAVSCYGNLDDICVMPNERVQKGEIIGSYNSLSEKEFLYQIDEKL